jgi:hypothetical protein
MMCGPCSIAAAMSPEERIALALERMKREDCLCPSCGKVHRWKLYRVEAGEDRESAVIELEPEQLSLF